MAVLTAGVAVKDDLLRELGVTSDYADVWAGAEDAEYQRDVREIYENTRARLLRKDMSKKRFDEVMRKCRDRNYVKKTAENLRELARIRKFWDVRVVELGITEEDVAQAVREAKDEIRAEMEQAEKERTANR